MPYILYKTDGTKLTTVDDASLDSTTNLTFVGKNYSGYGQVFNENFVKLLENFSSSTAPSLPIKGQLWYDSENKKLNFSPDGKMFKGVANMFIQQTSPSYQSLVKGDLWWDSNNLQLKAFDGSQFQIIGPLSPSATIGFWLPAKQVDPSNTQATVTILEAVINDNPVVVVSNREFNSAADSTLITDFPVIKRGITLAGANPDTGDSSQNGYVVWGSSAHSLTSNTASYALSALSLSKGGADKLLSNGTGTTYISASTSSQATTIAQRDISGSLYATVFNGVATSARYADLAERYEADAVYEEGTVLVIGGDKEVTITEKYSDTRVAGIVSKNPAYMMNSEAGTDETHPYIALKGRVPCKVVGTINKGDLLVTSTFPGYATATTHPDVATVIGKALGNQSEGFGFIEVLVV
jgi:hypothetical protein